VLRLSLDGRLETLFIGHFNTRLVTTLNYSAIANRHTLQITAAYTNSFKSTVTSRFPVTDLNNGDSSNEPTNSSLEETPVQFGILTSIVLLVSHRHGLTENASLLLLLQSFPWERALFAK
jgi:hypothetical protein